MDTNPAPALLARELDAFRRARAEADVGGAWTALERAHVLSQARLGDHLRVHLRMLGYAVRLRDRREIVGQVVRMALAPFGSLTGRTPRGNTGRSTVSAFAEMPIPADLRDAVASSTPERGLL